MPKSIPVSQTVLPDTITGGEGALACTITVDSAPGIIQLTTDQPSVLAPPGGQWPLFLGFPRGVTQQTIVIATTAVDRDVVARIGATETGVDEGQVANWRTTAHVLVLARNA